MSPTEKSGINSKLSISNKKFGDQTTADIFLLYGENHKLR